MNDTAGPLAVEKLAVLEAACQTVALAFSPDGRWLASADYDGHVRVWDFVLDTPEVAHTLPGWRGWVTQVAWIDDQSLVASDSWGGLQCRIATQPEAPVVWQHAEAHDGWIRALALSADRQRLATAGRDGRLRVWDASDGQPGKSWEQAGADHYALAWSPDGEVLHSADLLGRIASWRAADGHRLTELTLEGMHLYDRIQDVAGVRVLVADDDGQRLWIAGGQPIRTGNNLAKPTLDCVSWETGEAQRELTLDGENSGFIQGLIQHPSGVWMGASSGSPNNGRFFLHRPGDAEPFHVATDLSNAQALAMHPDGGRVVVAGINRGNQGNGAVRGTDGEYKANSSPLNLLGLSEVDPG